MVLFQNLGSRTAGSESKAREEKSERVRLANRARIGFAAAAWSEFQFTVIHHIGDLEAAIDFYVVGKLRDESELGCLRVHERLVVRKAQEDKSGSKAVLPRRDIFFEKELLAVSALKVCTVF